MEAAILKSTLKFEIMKLNIFLKNMHCRAAKSSLRIELRSELYAYLQVRIELPSHRAPTGALCGGYVRYLRIELLIMFHASNLEVRETGIYCFWLVRSIKRIFLEY